jgi:hypothetical protein
MRAGRFVCVALPIILTLCAIVCMMIAILSGAAHQKLYMFNVDLEKLEINPADLEHIVDNLDINIGRRQQTQTSAITASDLSLGNSYDVTLWGYCENKQDGKRECTRSTFDWANKRLKKDFLDDLGSAAGVRIELPDEVNDAIKVFSTGIKWTEVAFIASLVALGVELIVGIFANCTRIVSCLTWLIAIVAMIITGVAAGAATAMTFIIVGLLKGSEKFYGADADFNGQFLATVWIGYAFSLAATLFWLFTICCCKPEHRSKKDRHSTDGEKLLPAGTYQPLGASEFEMGNGYKSQQPSSYAPSFNRPPSHHGRSDLAYEPYSHRA